VDLVILLPPGFYFASKNHGIYKVLTKNEIWNVITKLGMFPRPDWIFSMRLLLHLAADY